VWIVERSAIANGVSGFAVRILSFSPADAGWVDSLHADDLQGRRWSNISVLAADLTGDGVPELVVGYRGLGDREPLDLDVVGYTPDGAPQVVAHPDRADRGSLVVQGVQMLNYAGVYAVGEQACCPGAFERRTMAFANGQLLEVATESVPPGSVPASEL
jgi:hypothetical protein